MPAPHEDLFDHLVVLVLESRSFDSLFGYLYEDDPPTEYRVCKAPWEQMEDICAPYPNSREIYEPNINRQVYGTDTVSGPFVALPTENLMRGFVRDYIRVAEDSKKWDGDLAVTPKLAQQIMSCFPPEAEPVLGTLARSFAVSDAWFSSVPSSTWPNATEPRRACQLRECSRTLARASWLRAFSDWTRRLFRRPRASSCCRRGLRGCRALSSRRRPTRPCTDWCRPRSSRA